ncbi:hypothetical protein ACWD6P_36525 [Streptomyces sp. NPDC002446]
MNQPRTQDLNSLISELVNDVRQDPTGALGPSVYETARLIALAPWLPGHTERIGFLLDQQNPDGSWAGPDGYALVPTLSAVQALLVLLGGDGGAAPPVSRDAVATAAERGLAAAAAVLAKSEQRAVPPTVVYFMIIPALVEDINARLATLPADTPGTAVRRLPLPHGMTDAVLRQLRADAWRNPLAGHYLEIVGPIAVHAAEMQPVDGAVGCSAAATAAWLGTDRPADPDHPSVRFLTATQARLGGPVPAMTSLTYYERAWILGNLATAGAPVDLLAPLAEGLPPQVGQSGAPTAPGFAYEAETSAIVLTALAQLRAPEEPHYLWQYDAGSHFMSTIPEHQPSHTTNAHVLEALGGYAKHQPADAARYHDAVARIARWLGERQQPDGSWSDKWHASPLFATARCVLALHRHAGPESTETVDRAVRWVLRSQHDDGSWGHWGGTAEETAYAVRILLDTRAGRAGGAARTEEDRAAERAALRGRDHLLRHGLGDRHPPLWIGKELYTPAHIVRAAVLGALLAAQRLN